jgi:hypothetical protein
VCLCKEHTGKTKTKKQKTIMDTLLQLQQDVNRTSLGLFYALLLSTFFTMTIFLGLTLGKHYEKTLSHIEVPTVHSAIRTSRRMEE